MRPVFTEEEQLPAVPKYAVMHGREKVAGELAWKELSDRWEAAGFTLWANGHLKNQGDDDSHREPRSAAAAGGP